mmetsp:Transcript_12859/g.42941  ORF Transcript_12859/g.42941 Transcript_12859/m.42941 type:complete len:241 (+) Transcript_12859:87-809(+)
MFIDWTSSGKRSSQISSMTASIERFTPMTAVSRIFLTPYATSWSSQFSDHLRPSRWIVVLILLNRTMRSCSASHGLISRTQSERWFSSLAAILALAFAFASSRFFFAAAATSGSTSSSSANQSSSSSSSAAAALTGAAALAAAGAAALAAALAGAAAGAPAAAMTARHFTPESAATCTYQRYACGAETLHGRPNLANVATSASENAYPTMYDLSARNVLSSATVEGAMVRVGARRKGGLA